jgi:hypothetical protein
MTNIKPAFTVDEIGGECPTEAIGRYTDTNQPFYFRARSGRWTLELGQPEWPTDYVNWPADVWPYETVAQGDDPTHGGMADADVLVILAANVPPLVVEGEVVPGSITDLPYCPPCAVDRTDPIGPRTRPLEITDTFINGVSYEMDGAGKLIAVKGRPDAQPH